MFMRGMRMLFVGFAIAALAAAPAVAQSTRPSTPPPQADAVQMPRPGAMVDPQAMGAWGQQVGEAAREMSRTRPEMAGIRSRGRLGATIQELTPELADYFGVKSGVLVASVQKDSAAEKAGLKAGDVITAVDGHDVATPAALVGALPAGDGSYDVTLT